jgi:LysR family transcriptional regulator, glycine cleavage system transcriptional activator
MFEIAAATGRIGDMRNENILRVACLGTFAIKCLVPKLREFRDRFPRISIHLSKLRSFEELVRHDYDVGIRYRSGQWARMLSDRISAEEVFPICGPMLLKQKHGLRTPEDPRFHTIIRIESDVMRDYWQLWLPRCSIPRTDSIRIR